MSKKQAKRPTITREFADRFAQKLEQLPAKKKTILTTKELVAENVHQLIYLLENGYSYDDLIVVLKEDGISLTKPTLRQYLNEAKKDRVSQNKTAKAERHLPEPSVEKQATQSVQQLPRKLGKSRLQSDDNLIRYPDGHGQPIEMKTDL
ncbi:MAG: hypothetical protein WBC73_00280 [Phormidesmis sp.]